MARTTRQTAIFGTEDWKKFYKTYQDADFQSYNFETLRKTFVDYLKLHHPETFNDFTGSSEFVAMIDLMAFMGQALSFRNDLNTRENFLATAERRNSVNHLSELISYKPARNLASNGFLKVQGVSTTENIQDYNRNNLANITVRWNDNTNDEWQEQFNTILNAVMLDSQKIGSPNNTASLLGIRTEEYSLNVAPGSLPVIPFTSVIDGNSMSFEVVNGTSIGSESIYEPAPKLDGSINILYRNDNTGFEGLNTGYFFYFKQGQIQTFDFNLQERISNRSIDVTTEGVNNDDVWLYQVDTEVGAVSDEWTFVENIYSANTSQNGTKSRKYFGISNRESDKISLNFGDGIFGEIPIGRFRVYSRKSNGLEYTINSEEIQNLDISFDYTSRTGRTETLTLTMGLTSAVSNAKANESIEDIKRRAPAKYYTQNRMVNGEDYNNFPYATQSSIIKSKAVNRTNIGASRYLDLVDPTGKYSSINAFGSDGLLYETLKEKIFQFTFLNKNDINDAIKNKIEPILASRGMNHYYYEKFPRVPVDTDIAWQTMTVVTNETTGYFKFPDTGLPVQIGDLVVAANNQNHIKENALIKFVAPIGFHFNKYNKLVEGTPVHNNFKEYIWTTITSLELDGTRQEQVHLQEGEGPVILNDFIPTDAIPVEIIPLFDSNLPLPIEQEIVDLVELYRDFGLKFDNLTNTWAIVHESELETAPWLVKLESTPDGYDVTTKSLRYFFASVMETRFYFDNHSQIFDPRTGKIVNDFIKVLRTNAKPGPSNSPLSSDVLLDIIDQTVESDGFVNDFNVEVSFTDRDRDGIADDPDFFRALVGPETDVYFQQTIDFDNLERFLPVDPALVNLEYGREQEIAEVKSQFINGQLFYATIDKLFFELVVNGNIRNVTPRPDMKVEHGRGDFNFQYRHNSPETTRINPSVTNIIDIYVVVSNYYKAYLNYIQDSTNTVAEPIPPTTDELTVQYSKLQKSKMTSDNMVLNSVKFKPLFGDKAAENVQAYIKVIKLSNTVTSDSEVKSRVISAINKYFEIDKWDFGDVFYFSELSAFLHAQLGDVVSSIIILPKDPTKVFGDLYEIKSAPYEIFTSAATVNDVVIIDTLTASKLQG